MIVEVLPEDGCRAVEPPMVLPGRPTARAGVGYGLLVGGMKLPLALAEPGLIDEYGGDAV